MNRKLYEALGLQPNPSKDDIRKAYKKLAVQNHPDKGGSEEKFKEIVHAYETLMDDQKRQMYDQLGDDGYEDFVKGRGGMGGGGAGFPESHMDIFAQMFGNFGGFPFTHGMHQHNQQVQRANHVHTINITLEQAYTGLTKNVRINVRKPCLRCMTTCGTCQGRGHITDMQRIGIFTQTMTRPCHVCQGSGKQAQRNNDCGNCKGAGHTSNESIHDIKIPAGVTSGYNVKLQGLGEQPQAHGEIAGDMVVHINVEDHPLFKRTGDSGRDLLYTHKISFKESVIGSAIRIPHVHEAFIVDTTKLGILVPGKVYVIKGQGMQGGDLHLSFDIKYPDKLLNGEEQRLLNEAFDKCGLNQ